MWAAFSIPFLFALLITPVYSQTLLTAWNLTADGQPSQVAANVNAGLFKGGTGTGAVTYGTNGAYANGWSTGTLDTADYFQVSISPASGYKIIIQSLLFSERRSLTCIRNYEVRCSANPAFSSPVTIAAVAVPDDDLERYGNITGLNITVNDGDTLFIRWYGYAAESSAGTWRINDTTLKVLGNVTQLNQNNTDSYLQPPSAQIGAGTISSLAVTTGQAVQVFKVNVTDSGSGDGLPTIVTLLALKAGPLNNVNWSNALAGMTIENGGLPADVDQTFITSGSIVVTIPQGNLTVADGGSAELTFSVYLKSSGITDGAILQFMVDSAGYGWDAALSGSGFQYSLPQQIISGIFTVDVTATRLIFTSVPQNVWATQPFAVTALTTDINNNLDIDGSLTVELARQVGNGILSSVAGLQKTPVNGVIFWDDLKYDISEYFSLSLSDVSMQIPAANSGLIFAIPYGQNLMLNESFSDGDFLSNPAWLGETGDFIINSSYQLQLYTATTSADTSYLVTPVWLQEDSVEWQVYVKLNFDPSDNNKIFYYLASDNVNLKDSLQGYFIRIGETGSSDAVELFFRNGQNVTSVCRGTDGFVASQPNVRIKVIRTAGGFWKVYADPAGGSDFELQASGTDNSFWSNGFFTGILCRYTSTYATGKYNFDDFYCGPVQVDTVKPFVASISAVDSVTLNVIFSEGISLSSAQNVMNFTVSGGTGNPSLSSRYPSDYKIVQLTFASPFVSAQQYFLSVTGISDLNGNVISDTGSIPFNWYKPVRFDILINELMADPTPAVALPEYEYMELYNKTLFRIDLSGWTLTIGSSNATFPVMSIEPDGYLIICTPAAKPFLQTYGTVAEIISSSSALTNAGNTIILRDRAGDVVHAVEYSDSWYKSSVKDDGGWSLEQIDFLNPCGGQGNWTASTDVSGGTPGRRNSVYAPNTDLLKPEITNAIINQPDTLQVTFSETVINSGILNPSAFNVSHGIGQPNTVFFTDILQKKVTLVFNQSFVKDTVYEITVTGLLSDCAGNSFAVTNSFRFAIPDILTPGEIIINEVMFNPYTGGTDYVELYNRSGKIYNLADLKLTELDDAGFPTDTDSYIISSDGFLMFPGEYIVLSADPEKIYPFYSCPYKKPFLILAEMPSYNNSSGRVTIINRSLQVVDDFSYTEEMHFKLLNSFEGVSLERIYPDLLTQDSDNWHSAAESAGFGTPGYRNSQYANFTGSQGEITVEPEVFSPDNDGFDDVLNIKYNFDTPGFIANVSVYDAKGRKIRNLINGELLGSEGFFAWDGLNDYNSKASIGIYIVYIEVFNLSGNVKKFKKVCVLASHLK